MDILRVEGIQAGYGNEVIIHDISFSMPPGTILGIIGPNGAGKTTLFRVISKLLKPRRGRVLFRGADLSGMSYRVFARHVSVIPQLRTLPPPFTVEEFVSLARYPHGTRLSTMNTEDKRIVSESLGLLNLEGFRTRRVNALSGGELQRVYLAQGLAQSPELILMDEPTTHLDITHKIRILDVISSLSRDTGLSALIILHDLNLTAAYCDQVIMIRDGGLFARGTPAEILTEDIITSVYETPVRVDVDPATKRPGIFFLPRAYHGK